MSRIVGIDLGTTNSLVATLENGQPRIVPSPHGERLLPSVVSLSPAGEIFVGTPALNQYALHPERTIRSVKRLMGSDTPVRLGDREYRPEEISALILRELKAWAERYLGGVPAEDARPSSGARSEGVPADPRRLRAVAQPAARRVDTESLPGRRVAVPLDQVREFEPGTPLYTQQDVLWDLLEIELAGIIGLGESWGNEGDTG